MADNYTKDSTYSSKEWTPSQFRDRACGVMGVGDDKDAEFSWENEGGAKPPSNASGWDSKSFDAGGLSNGSLPSSGQSTSDGPAWPSRSKDRK